MEEQLNCCYDKCQEFGHIFVDVKGKRYHLICWLHSMNIDLHNVQFNYDACKPILMMPQSEIDGNLDDK